MINVFRLRVSLFLVQQRAILVRWDCAAWVLADRALGWGRAGPPGVAGVTDLFGMPVRLVGGQSQFTWCRSERLLLLSCWVIHNYHILQFRIPTVGRTGQR